MMALKRLIARILLALPGGDRALSALRKAVRGPAIELPASGDAPELPFAVAVDGPGLVRSDYEGFTIIDRSALAAFDGLVYQPDAKSSWLPPGHLRNMALAMEVNGLDVVVASHGLEEPPVLRCMPSPNHTLRRVNGATGGLNGRVLRLLPEPEDGAADVTLSEIFPNQSVAHPAGVVADFHVGEAAKKPSFTGTWTPTPLARDKPVILVLPIFLAVGGVERNTIEIIRALRDRYHFVVVTTERLHRDQGSLHHQMSTVADVIYDLAEISENHLHLAVLRRLKDGYRPDLIWICNGSPWLADNAAALRDLFEDTPIVDQQVYDTKEGWIQRYGEAGIQSFDRFIAINSRIRDVFTSRLNMAPDRIDLIYSAIDAPRFDKPTPSETERLELAKAHGLPEDRACFAFIGRLVEQKNPLAFLSLAIQSAKAGKDDHFVLVGDGVLGPDCDAYIREHALENVTRIPFCDDLTRLYPILAGLIVSSHYEGLPIAMLEAMAMGVPVYATDVGDIGPVLDDYRSGLVCEDIEGGTAFRGGFVAWRERLAEFTEAAREAAPQVRKRFGVDAIAGNYEDCWRAAWKQRGRDV